MKKKKWEKPKLIVLVRGDKQEMVLLGCKYGSFSEAEGPEVTFGRCYVNAGEYCINICSEHTPS